MSTPRTPAACAAATCTTLPLSDAPEAYRSFRDKEDRMMKVVFTP